MKRLIILFALSTALFAQQTVTPANVTFSADAVAALNSYFTSQIVNAPTLLAAPLTAGATTMTVTDGTQVTINQEFLIGNEAVNPSSIVGNVVTIARADLGTTAAAHPTGTLVQVLKYKSLKNWCKQKLQEDIAAIMDTATYPTATTQNSALATTTATVTAAIAAAKAGAIQ